MIKGVLFDMDGTMLDTEPVSERCWKQAAQDYGFVIDDQFMQELFGKNLTTIREMLINILKTGETTEKIVEGRENYYVQFLLEEEVPKKKGLMDILQYLKENQIPAAVCTSTEKEIAELALKRAGIYEYFDAFVFGNMVTRGKPDPQGFQMAAEMLGLASEECLVLEDSINGVLAGKRAGGYVIHIPDVVEVPADVKDGITAEMKDLNEVLCWLEKRE